MHVATCLPHLRPRFPLFTHAITPWSPISSPQAIGLAINRGSLALSDWKLHQLLLLYTIPIYPTVRQAIGKNGRLADSAVGGKRMMLTFLAQLGEWQENRCLTDV